MPHECFMKRDLQRIFLAAAIPLFFLFILYMLKFLEVGMEWDFTHLGIYPMEKRGLFGIFAHPLVHSSFAHLAANTLPLFFLSWCLFYFYRDIAPYIFFLIWIGGGIFTFLFGKSGWHVGSSGIIYGLAFFLFSAVSCVSMSLSLPLHCWSHSSTADWCGTCFHNLPKLLPHGKGTWEVP